MPSFEQLIMSAPLGFANSCLALNTVANEDEGGLANAVTESYYHVVKKTEISILKYHREKKAIAFIIRSMKSAQPTPSISNAANILLSKSFLTQDSVEKILLKVKELSGTDSSEIESIMKVRNFMVHGLTFKFFCVFSLFQTNGKLKNFQWKIGVAVSSSTCKNLFSPYISVRYDIIEEDGTATPYTTELSYEQFKDFKSAFEKVAKVMDVV